MVTIKCGPPCRFGIGAPTGEHYHHHHHSFSEPDCIIEEAEFHFGITDYDFNESEYNELRATAIKLGLDREIISELDYNYKGMHRLCEYELIKRGTMNSMAGMCWDIAIDNYHEIAEFIRKCVREGRIPSEGPFGDIRVSFL